MTGPSDHSVTVEVPTTWAEAAEDALVSMYDRASLNPPKRIHPSDKRPFSEELRYQKERLAIGKSRLQSDLAKERRPGNMPTTKPPTVRNSEGSRVASRLPKKIIHGLGVPVKENAPNIPLRYKAAVESNLMFANKIPPNPLLVGVETNPGPKVRTISKKLRQEEAMLNKNKSNRTSKFKAMLGTTNNPVSTAYTRTQGQPKRVTLANGDVLVTHSELVAGIITPGVTTFNVKGQYISPYNDELFRWLPRISSDFESYQFEKLDFEFVPGCPTSTAGKIYMAVDYDPSDNSPVDDVEIMSHRGAVSNNVFGACTVRCNNADMRKQKSYYTGPYDHTSSANLLQRVVGNLYYATQYASTNTYIGDIFANYTVRLSTPQLDTSTNATLLTHAEAGFAVDNLVGNVLSAGGQYKTNGDYIKIGVTTSTDGFTFKKSGTWFINGVIIGTGFTAGSTPSTAGSSLTLSSNAAYGGTSTVTSTAIQINVIVTVPVLDNSSNGATLKWSTAAATGFTKADWLITQLPDNYGMGGTLALFKPNPVTKSISLTTNYEERKNDDFDYSCPSTPIDTNVQSHDLANSIHLEPSFAKKLAKLALGNSQ